LAKLIEGKPIAAGIKAYVKHEASLIEHAYGRRPTLGCLVIGEDPASCLYGRSQARIAEEVGLKYVLQALPALTDENGLIEAIERWNTDPGIDAFMVQTPLPARVRRHAILEHIAPEKDAEGVDPTNLGRLILGLSDAIAPCTARACYEILKISKVPLRGREVVIVGHSAIVGKPLALLLVNDLATVTMCHVATSEAGHLEDHVRRADVLIVAVGRPRVIPGAWVKEGAVVVDVGINHCGDKVVGDVGFEEAVQRASMITPVPGGVGPVTVAILMRNVVELFKKRIAV
jgi:methylenetetrahydrofolate dehydrogenase (NADP+)/methenyltetrahydrofolate cyclohydrolase